jgi:competence protein ComEC
MKQLRTALMLSIFLLVSTLCWPHLLDKFSVSIAIVITLILLLVPRLRVFIIIPITAIYFSTYVNLTLTGQLLPFSKAINDISIVEFIDGEDHSIVVEVISLISKNNRGYFKAKLIELDTDQLNYSPLVEMRWYRPNVNVQAGQRHRFTVRIKPVYGRANPGGFDRQKWSYSEHVAYQMTVKKHIEQIDNSLTFRSHFYEKVKSTTENFKNQGLLLALSFADKTLITFDDKTRIRNLGISHLFAISGLHIGLLFGVFYLLAQSFYQRILPASKMGWFSIRLINISALIGAWGYAYLAGFSLPTQRAFLMLLIAVIILSLKRKCSQTDVLLLVLFVVLVWDPLAILSVSLWLSFSAVAIILLLLWSVPINDDNHAQNVQAGHQNSSLKSKIIKYVKLLLTLQLGLTFLMLPIQLDIFSGLSLVAIIINLIAIPLFSILIIPMVLFATGMALVYQPISLITFHASDAIISFFFYISEFANHSYLHFSLLHKNLLMIVFSVLLLVFVSYFQSKKIRKVSYLFTVVILCLVSLPKPNDNDTWFVETIDVGQGLAVVIRSADQVLLYDTGARYPSGFSMVDSEIAPYFISMGINQIDHLVVSHSDNDHAGGADIIVDKFTVKQLWSGEPLKSKYDFTQCVRGQRWKLGILEVEVLSPTILTNNDNNNSCVLRISDGSTAVLLTGDIEKRQEKVLTKILLEKLNSDILFAPHHGSRHSSNESFIKAVSPKWVVFSAGFMNQWGFPANEVVERYEKQSVKSFNSGLSGFIRFQISTQDIKIKTFREDLAPYWYHHSFE